MRYFWVFLNFNHAPSVKHRIRNERKLSFYKLEEINSGGVKLKKWNHKVGNEITLKSKDKNNHPLSSHGPCAHTHARCTLPCLLVRERESAREQERCRKSANWGPFYRRSFPFEAPLICHRFKLSFVFCHRRNLSLRCCAVPGHLAPLAGCCPISPPFFFSSVLRPASIPFSGELISNSFLRLVSLLYL